CVWWVVCVCVCDKRAVELFRCQLPNQIKAKLTRKKCMCGCVCVCVHVCVCASMSFSHSPLPLSILSLSPSSLSLPLLSSLSVSLSRELLHKWRTINITWREGCGHQ